MRDIRTDLSERLEAMAAEKARLQGQIDAISQNEAAAQAMLHNEVERVSRLHMTHAELPSAAEEPHAASPSLGMLIKRVLTIKNRPLAMEEIRDEIIRWNTLDFGEKRPGRSIHFGLVSLKNGGEVERLDDGRWNLIAHQDVKVPVQETQLA